MEKTYKMTIDPSILKTRGKKCADSVSPLKNKDETMKTVGKKTVGKGEKTRGKSLETRGKKAECLL